MPDSAPSDNDTAVNDETVPIVSVARGEFVFQAGDKADSFFIISTGQVELLRRGETHGRLALLAAGDLCGEDSAFEGQARAYDARAVMSATLLRVSATMFLDLIRVRPELAGAVISWTAARLLKARAACVALAFPSERVTTARFVHVETGLQFPLPDASESVVGRADRLMQSQPDVELSSVDTHRSLSRRHAVISRAGNDYEIIEEPRVANGTFLNGTRLSPGVPVPIREGDEVSFGLITTVFRTT